ncbi:MAG: thiopurine S-methyltransferase, partial [Deltaproteobacteria bacterium]
MEKEFWLNVWEDGSRLGFHQENYHTLLLRYFTKLETKLGSRILVPLCGKTWDLEWLENKGLDVHGVELSPIAVKSYFTERGII